MDDKIIELAKKITHRHLMQFYQGIFLEIVNHEHLLEERRRLLKQCGESEKNRLNDKIRRAIRNLLKPK